MSKFNSYKGCPVRRVALLFFILLFVFGFFASCTTPPAISTFLIGDGKMQYFIRPIPIKGKDLVSSVDFTIHVSDGVPEDSVVVNYTLDGQPLGEINAEKVKVSLICGEKEFALEDSKVLYKSVTPNAVRFTSTLKSKDFVSLVYDESMITLCFTSSSGKQVKVDSSKLRKSFSDLRSVVIESN